MLCGSKSVNYFSSYSSTKRHDALHENREQVTQVYFEICTNEVSIGVFNLQRWYLYSSTATLGFGEDVMLQAEVQKVKKHNLAKQTIKQ